MDSDTTKNLNSLNPHFCSSSSTHRWTYDVFLSFTGKDTCKNFTDHLYVALTQAGIKTFRHDYGVPIGNDISSELLKAIRESKVSIVVFSKDYASSCSCLDELVNILHCKDTMGQLVLPVFYDIDLSDVREQTGPFAKALEKHEAEFLAEMEKVERWRAALAQAADLSGWDLQNVANGYEAKFIKEIVWHVRHVVKHKKLQVAKYPVGLESRVEFLNSLLRIGSDEVCMVGIYGMGGVGKTTIAKAFYNSAFHLFEGSCFLANIREVSEHPNGVAHLQEQLLSEILKQKKLKVANEHIGITFIKQRLCRKRVLIVLDDLDELSQLKKLAGDRHWFGLGSRIIITTRNENLLSQAKVDEKYEARELNDNDSLRLFSWHAFQKPNPLESYENLSKDIVHYTQGLPLALEVLGASFLGQTTKELWDSTLEKLKKIPPNQVLEKLRISFDALADDKVKDIFLDIACFFIGMDKDYSMDIFDGCGFFPGVGISILIDRCLLKIGQSNKLRMHDLVRDMGREVVREKFPYKPGKRSRLWFHNDVSDVLRKHEGSEAIEGLIMDLPRPMHLSTKAFAIMKRLRLLKINNVHLHGSFKGLFEELRWLCWHHCPLEHLPSELRLEKLVALDMQHSNLRMWHGIKFVANLKSLNLSNSKFLRTTPDFSGVPKLNDLSLRFCSSLLEVDPSIGYLDKLINLNLGHCENLKSLPRTIGNLRLLETLYLDDCSNLERLPEEIGHIETLMELHASRTAIKELPDSVGLLRKLRTVSLAECNGREIKAKPWFSFFPFNIPRQTPTENKFLPPAVSSLSSIKTLELSDSNLSDADVPSDLSELSSLRFLHLNGNNFCCLPSSIGQLCNLEYLWLHDCRTLQSILELPPNLRSLDANNCPLLENLPDLSNLKQLECLDFINCSSLAVVQGLQNLDSIKEIYLEGCSNLANAFEENLFQGHSKGVQSRSIFLSRREIPQWFNHQRSGSVISFDVPSDVESDVLQMTIWVDYVNMKKDNFGVALQATINNKTKGIEWTHEASIFKTLQVNSWVSHGPQPYPVQGGDRIELSIGRDEDLKVEKCGIHLTYKQVDSMRFVDVINGKRGYVTVETSCDSSKESKLSKRLKMD